MSLEQQRWNLLGSPSFRRYANVSLHLSTTASYFFDNLYIFWKKNFFIPDFMPTWQEKVPRIWITKWMWREMAQKCFKPWTTHFIGLWNLWNLPRTFCHNLGQTALRSPRGPGGSPGRLLKPTTILSSSLNSEAGTKVSYGTQSSFFFGKPSSSFLRPPTYW